MSAKSAGIIPYKYEGSELKVLLVHPGGPFWKNKDDGTWSIPKGVYGEDEDPLKAAKREFKEETGFDVDGEFLNLGGIKQSGGKVVCSWALGRDLDTEKIESNTFEMEWPPKTGNIQEYPEIDKAKWFSLEEAKRKILKNQAPLLDRLTQQLNQ